METTLTARDKALLLVLAIILVVFAAIMIPNYGIYALLTTRSETKAEIDAQKIENQKLYADLIVSGINGAYAENGAMAKKYLENKLLEQKHDLAHQSNSVCRQDSFDTAKNWIYTMKYKGFVVGETAYFDSLNVTAQVVTPDDILTEGETSYDVNKYIADVDAILSTDIDFNFELDFCNNNDSINDLASMLVLASQAIRRGSCYVSEFDYNKAIGEDAKTTISVTIVVYTPASTDYSKYASEICECHECGYAYTKDWFLTKSEEATIEGDGIVKCPDCELVLDGTTIG